MDYTRKECSKLVSYTSQCPLMGATPLHNGHLIKKAAILLVDSHLLMPGFGWAMLSLCIYYFPFLECTLILRVGSGGKRNAWFQVDYFTSFNDLEMRALRSYSTKVREV